MGLYENDPYRDENGEALMNYDDDDVPSDDDVGESPRPLVDDDILEDEEVWDQYDQSADTGKTGATAVSKTRKRLVKKSDKGGGDGGGSSSGANPSFLLDDDLDDEGVADFENDYPGYEEDEDRKRKKKKKSGDGGSGSGSGRKKLKMVKKSYSGRGKEHDHGDQEVVKEMWDTIAGGDSEDDKDGVRNLEDDNFIDDTGVDPADRYGSDNDRSPTHAPQAEEGEDDDEISQLFSSGKKKKKTERSAAEVAMLVERVMADLEVTAEEDAELNRQSKPAICKLMKLPLLTDVLSKKQLQLEFLDHGVLTLLKNWLEPLPDQSLPNINIREAILKILTDYPIDLDQYDRKEQLKKSGLGKVIMFLSRSAEETTSNRKLAKDLVDKWSRPIFNKSTRFEDMKNYEDERVPFRRPTVKKPANKNGGLESRDDDLDLSRRTQEPKSGKSSAMLHASRPEAMSLDFLVRPQSKIDPDEVRARARQVVQDQRRVKMNKKLQQLKAPKKKQLQATRCSVEGRGMVKYL